LFGDAGVTDSDILSMALYLRNQEMSLRDIGKRLVITTGAKKGPASLARHCHAGTAPVDLGRMPPPQRWMLREHDERVATAVST
jgi:hypothetical protein